MDLLFLFIFGISIGSFLNCCIYRLNYNLSPLRGRSMCPKCKHKLAWRDNIPLLSFVLLGGKCRYCHSPISFQYPLVELATGLLTVLVFRLSNYKLGITSFNLLITYALIAIFVSDLRYGIIPDEIVVSGSVISLIYLILNNQRVLLSNILCGVAAASFFLFLVWVTHGRGMGMGDVKLVGLLGLFLGGPKILVALMLAFLTGAMVGAILILTTKKKFGQHISFGPFLTAAAWVSLFWGDFIWKWYWKTFL